MQINSQVTAITQVGISKHDTSTLVLHFVHQAVLLSAS